MVERPDGREIAKPVELRVMVGDANDNRPTFPQAQYHTVVKELASRGIRLVHLFKCLISPDHMWLFIEQQRGSSLSPKNNPVSN